MVKAELIAKPQVTLTMDHDIAVTLQTILWRIGGDERTTYRSDADEISAALSLLGIEEDEDRATESAGLWMTERK